jgi:hypothetical protein
MQITPIHEVIALSANGHVGMAAWAGTPACPVPPGLGRAARQRCHGRWTGRTLRVEVEGWVDPGLSARPADANGRQVAGALGRELPEAGSLTWASRAAPAALATPTRG